MIVTRAPGKVILAGEYAVLLPRQPCLVAAVDRRISARADSAESWSVSGMGKTWSDGEPVPPELSFAVATVEAARSRWSLPPLHVVTEGTFAHGGRKIGLGGSGATVAAISVALGKQAFASPKEIDSLAHAVHRDVQGGKGSGADVAASLHGGVLRYVRNESPSRVSPHSDLRLLLAFTGSSAATSPRVARFDEVARRHFGAIDQFARESKGAVDGLSQGLEAGDLERIRESVQRSREALDSLSTLLETPIETDELRRASDAAFSVGAAGKSSGAGGGDCSVLFAIGDEMAQRVTTAVEQLGLIVLEAPIATQGALDSWSMEGS